MQLRPQNIGGAIVRRTFTNGVDADGAPRRLRMGDQLSAEEVRRMPAANRQALVDKHFLDVYPPAPGAGSIIGDGPAGEHFIIRTPGFASKTYDVILGTKVAEGLTKDQAETVAQGPVSPQDSPSDDAKN